MSNFRIKKQVNIRKQPISIRSSNTLENKHLDKIKMIEKKRNSLDKLKNNLNKIIKELNDIDEIRNNTNRIDIDKRAELLVEQDRLLEEIRSIENNNEEINYYDMAGDILEEYYEIKNKNDEEKKTKSILQYLTPKVENTQVKTTRASLFNQYCQRIEGIRIEQDDGKNRIKYCETCNIEKVLDINESSYICTSCGLMEYVLIDEDNMIKDYSPYQRRNHFKEWLNQFQAKETTEISDEIFDNIMNEISKNKITDMKKINRHKMQKILKKLGYNKLYEHIPFIINKITGISAPRITRDDEEKFINMFRMIQEPWEIYKPKGRKNFLSYPYILYKFSELLELDHLLPYFPMLQQNKLKEQDMIWEKFCKHLKWEFYATI